jgi:hypothetical protein
VRLGALFPLVDYKHPLIVCKPFEERFASRWPKRMSLRSACAVISQLHAVFTFPATTAARSMRVVIGPEAQQQKALAADLKHVIVRRSCVPLALTNH